MKRLFLDTNFLIDYLVREEFKAASLQFLIRTKERGCRFFISYLSVANFAYIVRKYPKEEVYRNLAMICHLFEVVPNNLDQLNRTIAMGPADFEDGLQYHAALDARCDCIITRNQKDFSFSELPVMSASEYLDTL